MSCHFILNLTLKKISKKKRKTFRNKRDMCWRHVLFFQSILISLLCSYAVYIYGEIGWCIVTFLTMYDCTIINFHILFLSAAYPYMVYGWKKLKKETNSQTVKFFVHRFILKNNCKLRYFWLVSVPPVMYVELYVLLNLYLTCGNSDIFRVQYIYTI